MPEDGDVEFLGLAVKRIVTSLSGVEILVGAAELERSKSEVFDCMFQLFDTLRDTRVHTGHAHELVRVGSDICLPCRRLT